MSVFLMVGVNWCSTCLFYSPEPRGNVIRTSRFDVGIDSAFDTVNKAGHSASAYEAASQMYFTRLPFKRVLETRLMNRDELFTTNVQDTGFVLYVDGASGIRLFLFFFLFFYNLCFWRYARVVPLAMRLSMRGRSVLQQTSSSAHVVFTCSLGNHACLCTLLRGFMAPLQMLLHLLSGILTQKKKKKRFNLGTSFAREAHDCDTQ